MAPPEPNTDNRAEEAERGGKGASAAVLDDWATIELLDPHGLLGRIEALPEQCEEARQRASGLELPPSYAGVARMVVLGMGGSAISGDILRSLAEVSGRKPVSVVRGYDAPAYVDGETLVVACSHSGNTEETLSAFESALAAGARTVVVTAGGRLGELAAKHGVRVHVYEYEGEPRASLGHQLMSLLAVAERAGVVELREQAVAEAVSVMQERRRCLGFESPLRDNPAKQMAGRLRERLPVVVGAGPLTAAAHRWKTQLNENSEVWALWEELPELDHNSVAGFRLPKGIIDRLHVVFLMQPSLHERVLLRTDATAAALSEAGISSERVEVEGSGPLAQIMSAIYLGDFVSYYLALLNGVEPSPVVAIDRLKARMAGL